MCQVHSDWMVPMVLKESRVIEVLMVTRVLVGIVGNLVSKVMLE